MNKNKTSVNITPTEIKTSNTCNSLSIEVSDLILNTSARIIVRLMDNDKLLDVKTYVLSGTDYSNWGSDDNYITTYVMAQLGFSPL